MRTHKDTVLNQLRDASVAAAYLNEHIKFKGPHDQELLLEAIRNILKAQGIDEFAKKSGLSRRTLYHAVSKKGNPTVELFLNILDQLKMDIQFFSRENLKSKRSTKKIA